MLQHKKKNVLYFIINLGIISLFISTTIIEVNAEEIRSTNAPNTTIFLYSTSFFETHITTENDTDADGMPDSWELLHDLDITRDDSAYDYDYDELTNIEEYQYNTDPWVKDTDGDRFNDGFEVDKGTDPADPNDHPVRVWLYILIAVISVALVAGASWITIITIKDKKLETK